MTITLEFFTNSYAPCMVQARPVSDRHLAMIKRTMRDNGAPPEALVEDTTILSWEDAEHFLSRRNFLDLQRGWPVRQRFDEWTARHLYGWQVD